MEAADATSDVTTSSVSFHSPALRSASIRFDRLRSVCTSARSIIALSRSESVSLHFAAGPFFFGR